MKVVSEDNKSWFSIVWPNFEKNHKIAWKFWVSCKNNWPIVFLGVILVGMLVFGVFYYYEVEDRVDALRSSENMLNQTFSNSENPRATLDFWIEGGISNSSGLTNKLREIVTKSVENSSINSENATIISESDQKELRSFYTDLYASVYQFKHLSNLTDKLTKDIVESEQNLSSLGINPKGTTYEPLTKITEELTNIGKRLEQAFNKAINSSDAAIAGDHFELHNLNEHSIEINNLFYQAKSEVEVAKNTLAAGRINILAPYALVYSLYAIFVIFPWLILAFFYLRKKPKIIEAKERFFGQLNLSKAQINRGFRDSEYAVSIVILTVINVLFFYFFFFPYSYEGIAQLISLKGGAIAFLQYLVKDITPITAGFLGAYYFVLQMLIRRYFSNDLTPKPYIYAVVRVLTVFILCIILQLASSEISESMVIVSLFAFVVGIFPRVGINWIIRTVNKLVTTARAPEIMNQNGLTELEGLNIWHESRLFEENIENVQNLATAPLDELLANTNFSDQTIVDWVDQSLLFIHTKDNWKKSFRLVGIRTATDFLDCTDCKVDKNRICDLVTAVNDSQTLIFNPPSDSPVNQTILAVEKFVNSVVKNGSFANELNELADKLDNNNKTTYSVFAELKEQFDKFVEEFNKLKVPQKLSETLEDLLKDSNEIKKIDDAISKITEIKNDEPSTITSCKSEIQKLDFKKLEPLKDSTISDCLGSISEKVEEINSKTKEIVENFEEKSEEIKEAVNDEKRFTEIKQDFGKESELVKSSDEISKKIKSVKELFKCIDKDKPETFNKFKKLQADLETLLKNANDSVEKFKKTKDCLKEVEVSQVLLDDVNKCSEATDKALAELIKKVNETKDVASGLDIDKSETMKNLPDAKKFVNEINKAAKDLKTKAQKTKTAIKVAVTPPKITSEIVNALRKNLEKGPTIDSLKNYWDKERKQNTYSNQSKKPS